MATVLTFKEWQIFMVENTPDEQDIDCPYCKGEGVICEECCECGHEKEDECATCSGLGNVVFDELTKGQQIESFTKEKYITQLSEDLKKLAEWTGEKYWETLNKNGFALCTVIRTKEDKVVGI